MGANLLTYKTEFVLFLALLKILSCRQLTRDVKSEVRTLNFISDDIFAPPRKALA